MYTDKRAVFILGSGQYSLLAPCFRDGMPLISLLMRTKRQTKYGLQVMRMRSSMRRSYSIRFCSSIVVIFVCLASLNLGIFIPWNGRLYASVWKFWLLSSSSSPTDVNRDPGHLACAGTLIYELRWPYFYLFILCMLLHFVSSAASIIPPLSHDMHGRPHVHFIKDKSSD